MDRYLATLNKLQDVFTAAKVSAKEIDIPQIVVVGSQSTGKSSVLENIAKQNFLPRGAGIKTRRPLVLQMIKAASRKRISNRSYDTWVEFLHKKDNVFTDMAKVQKEIESATDKICGQGKVISNEAIHLKLYSTKIPSLTLVDLPGLTKIPVQDQPKDIERRIEKLVRSYIEKENTIILAVSAGNVDIANSDSLKLAKEVDPTGSRTIAVITKCDLMENNDESAAVLSGVSVDVKLGLIGVINRNNQQLDEKTPIEKILSIEEEYFLTNFPGIADRMGTEYLTSQLCDILISHLKKCLPMLADKISLQQARHREILKEVGEEPTDPNQGMIMLLSNFTDSLSKSMDGTYTYTIMKSKPKVTSLKKALLKAEQNEEEALDAPMEYQTTSAGAELFNVFETECTHKLSEIPPDKNLKNLKEVIRGTSGVQPALFIPDGVFNTLIKKQLDLFDQPSEHAITKSHQCIAQAIEVIAEKTIGRYPKLEREVVNISKDFLSKQAKDAKEFLAEYLEVEKSYINTNHPEFIKRYQIAAELFAEPDVDEERQKPQARASLYSNANYTYHKPAGKESALEKLFTKYTRGEDASSEDRANKEAELMEKLLIHYFCIVRAQIVDMIPKIVMRFFVKKLSTHLNSALIKVLYTEEKIAELVQESDRVSKKRKASSNMMKVLLEAEKLASGIAVGNKRIKPCS